MPNRLHAVQRALAARGVRDIKVVWAPEAQSASLQARQDSLLDLLESYLAGKVTPVLRLEPGL